MKTFKDLREPTKDRIEDAPANAAGLGGVAGLGVGAQGEPPGRSHITKTSCPKCHGAGSVDGSRCEKCEGLGRLTEELFAGAKVFDVEPHRFHACRMGKRRYERYEKYVGNDEVGETIRQYGRQNRGRPIIVRNNVSGSMMYLRYGRRNRVYAPHVNS
jgi:hypothetical protein